MRNKQKNVAECMVIPPLSKGTSDHNNIIFQKNSSFLFWTYSFIKKSVYIKNKIYSLRHFMWEKEFSESSFVKIK